jgi:hypothetical protein
MLKSRERHYDILVSPSAQTRAEIRHESQSSRADWFAIGRTKWPTHRVLRAHRSAGRTEWIAISSEPTGWLDCRFRAALTTVAVSSFPMPTPLAMGMPRAVVWAASCHATRAARIVRLTVKARKVSRCMRPHHVHALRRHEDPVLDQRAARHCAPKPAKAAAFQP